MEEIWKKIEDYEDYEVSNLGNVRSTKRGNTKMLKPAIWWSQSSHKTEEKYLCVTLQQNGTRKCWAIHRLVANAFLPQDQKRLQINHKNGIKDDNRAENLEWCSQSENVIHCAYVLQKNRKYLNRISQFDKKGKLIKVFENVRDAANETGTKHGNILKCANRERNIAGGFIWRYSKQYSKDEFSIFDNKRICEYTAKGTFVKEYPSIKDLIEEKGYDLMKIKNVIMGRQQTAYRRIWKLI